MLVRTLSALGLLASLASIVLVSGCADSDSNADPSGAAGASPSGAAGASTAGSNAQGGASASAGSGENGGETSVGGASAAGAGGDLLLGPKPCTDQTEVGAASPSAGARTVKTGGKSLGKTAALIGFSATDVNPKSNALLWARYSGAMTFRTFGAVPPQKGPNDAGFGDGVTSLATFTSSRQAVSSAPATSPLLDLKNIATKISGSKAFGALGLANALNAPMVVEIKTRRDDIPLDHAPSNAADWKSNWEVWKNYFANAFVFARDYGVSRFEIYNEPDLTGIDAYSSVDDYTIRARLAGDAIQQAVAAANPQLKAIVIGPTSATGSGSDWGKALVAERNSGPTGAAAPAGYTLFQGYGYHSYNGDGAGGLTTIQGINEAVLKPAGLTLPWFITEFNALTNADTRTKYGTTAYAADVPDFARRLTDKAMGYSIANVGPMNLYSFNFLSNEDDSTSPSGTTNNGLHWATPAPESIIGGDSLAAAGYRLLTQHFGGERELLGLDIAADPDDGAKSPVTQFEATFDERADAYFILALNRTTKAKKVFFDLASLALPAGSVATVLDVDATHHGEVTHRIILSSKSTLEISQEPNALTLLSVPKHAGTLASVGATADTTLAPGAQSGTRFGTDPTLELAADSTNTTKLRSAVLGFSLPALAGQTLGQAVLELSLTPDSAKSTAADVIHLYGLADKPWTDDATTGARWSDVTALRTLADKSKYAQIKDNAIAYSDADLRIAGSALVSNGVLRVDVTDYVREQIALKHDHVTLLLVREVNRHQEAIAYSASFRSRESTCGGPSLSFRFFAQ